jgi:3-hydroxybutyryl-CoA dehydratase
MVNQVKYGEIFVGRQASFAKTVTEHDIYAFAGVSGDFNPLHVDEEFGKKTRFKGRIAHGILGASFISTVIGTLLPGIGALYLGQELRFTLPVRVGDTLTTTAEVTEMRDDKKIITLKTVVTNQKGEVVIDGKAAVMVMDLEER